MLKFKKNEKYASIAFYASIATVATLLIIAAIINISALWSFIKRVISMLSPVIYAIVFAYVTNAIMVFYENRVFKFRKAKKDRTKLRRILSLIFAILTILALLAVLAYSIIPATLDSMNSFEKNLEIYVDKVSDFGDKVVGKFSFIFSPGEKYDSLDEYLEARDISFDVKKIVTDSFSGILSSVTNVLSYLGSFVNGVINVIMGTFLAVYFLISKNRICAQLKKFMAAVLPRRAYLNTVRLGRYTHKTFGSFLIGKLIDSLIIGFISFFFLWIFGVPYYPLLAVIVGIFNIVPTFGPILAGVICSLFLLLVSPENVIVFIIFDLVIQQIDGNVIGPKILGNSIGISATWVMFAIVVSGALFGFAGMIVGVPIVAVIYALVKQWCEKRLKKKNMPFHTAYYENDPPTDDGSYIILDKDAEIPPVSLEDDIEDEEEELSSNGFLWKKSSKIIKGRIKKK